MEQEDSEVEEVAKKDGSMAGKGWEIVILEVSFTIKDAFTLTFRAPQLKEITINMCKIKIIESALRLDNFLDPAFRFPVSRLDDPRLHHTLGYIENIVNHKEEFILDEALAVCLHKVHSAKFQVF